MKEKNRIIRRKSISRKIEGPGIEKRQHHHNQWRGYHKPTSARLPASKIGAASSENQLAASA